MSVKFLLCILAAIFIALAVIFFMLRRPNKTLPTATLRVGTHSYIVEVADTLVSQARGLSGRDRLADRSGMLFVFEHPVVQSFWMQGMQFDLDFIWIAGQKVIGVTENVPFKPATAIQKPPAPADMVLEVTAGTVAKDGIKVGDVVELQ